MQFQVPQFIDIEDKIIGPLTLKQFLYLAGAGAGSFIFFFMFETWLWATFTLALVGIAVMLAFIKYNGRPMIFMLGAMFKFLWQPKLYLWQRQVQKEPVAVVKREKRGQGMSKNPLKNLLLRLNTSRGPIGGRERNSPEAIKASY